MSKQMTPSDSPSYWLPKNLNFWYNLKYPPAQDTKQTMSKQMTSKDSPHSIRQLTDGQIRWLSNLPTSPEEYPPALATKQTMSEQKHSSAASSEQVGGAHYKKCEIQPWDYTIANDLDYFQGSIIKYVTRWKDKGWIQDLYKARHFLDKYIETMEAKYEGLKERPEK